MLGTSQKGLTSDLCAQNRAMSCTIVQNCKEGGAAAKKLGHVAGEGRSEESGAHGKGWERKGVQDGWVSGQLGLVLPRGQSNED